MKKLVLSIVLAAVLVSLLAPCIPGRPQGRMAGVASQIHRRSVTVKVFVTDSPDFGLVVTDEVKGIRGGREWVTNEIESTLAYHADGTVGVGYLEPADRCDRRLAR